MEKKIIFTMVLAWSCQLPIAPLAWAQDQPSATLEEIIVTARKREEPLQDTPVAVTALSGESLDRIFATDTMDLNLRAPNVQVHSSFGANNTMAVFIRGVGNSDVDSTIDPPIALFLDGVYIPRGQNSALDLFDVEQVELLRGPQGTLFGRNTTGGAIHYRSRRPTGDRAARGSITVGKYGQRDVRLAVETPLVEDRVAAKVAVFSQQMDGFFTNTYSASPGQRAASDAGGTNALSIRPTLRFTPSEGFELTLIGEYLRERSEVPPTINASRPTQALQFFHGNPPSYPAGKDIREVSFNSDRFTDVDIWGLTVEAVWDVGPGQLTSISNYRETEELTGVDIDVTPARFFETLRDQPHDQWSSELRYNTVFGERAELVAGLYYMEQDYDIQRESWIDATNTGNFGHIWALATQQHSNAAVFAQLDYNLTERTRVSFGGRYTEEDKDFSATLYYPYPLLSPRYDLSDSWSNFGPKVGIDHRFSDNAMAYASYSVGFKSGGMNGRGGSPTALGPFDEETVDALEAGFKTDWLDGRLRANVALFWNEYDDLQRTIIRFLPGEANPQETVTANAASTTIRGVEIELSMLPTPELQLDFSLGYNDASYDMFFGDLNGDRIETDNSGIDLQYAPKLTAYGGVSYTLSVGNAGNLVLRGDVIHAGKQNTLATGDPRGVIGAYQIADASLTWQPAGGAYSVSFFVKNLFDEIYASSFLQGAQLFDAYALSPPRRWGLTLGFDF